MTQEDKQLLLKDLCMRLPYGVQLRIDDIYTKIWSVEDVSINGYQIDRFDIKPYLRPMSSMTEEEKKEYELLANRCITNSVGFIHFDAQELINWLLKNHFDFMGLIPKGLAIEVNENNNPYK